MKESGLIILLVAFLLSCSERNEKDDTAQQIETTDTEVPSRVDPVQETPEIQITQEETLTAPITNEPLKELQEFTESIEKMNWVPDTARLKKVGIYSELNREGVKYFNDQPFYTIDFDHTLVNAACKGESFYKSYMRHLDSLDCDLYGSVKNIWGYFYRDKEATEWISDGVIEQWEFENEAKAREALRQIMQPGFIIYFNTNPYYCSIGNKLIIFHTRAMAFSFDQGPLFEQFAMESGAFTLYKED